MTTVDEARKLGEWQFDLIPLLPKAREIETTRETAKRGWSHNAYKNRGAHLFGAVGEVLIADILGTEPDTEARPSDLGIDGTWQDQTYDVKVSTFVKSPDLKVPVDSKYWADLYFLVAVDQDCLVGTVCGWATKEEVQSAPTKQYGNSWKYKPNHAIPAAALHPMSDLVM